MTLANHEAEAGIICGVLHGRPEEQDRILKALTPRDFHTPAHEDIWGTLKAMQAEGRVIDGITVMSGLAKHGHQQHQALIPDIMTMGTPAVSALAYAKDVKDLAVRRSLQAMGTRVQQLAEAPDATPAELAAIAQQELDAAYTAEEETKTHAQDHVTAVLSDLEDPTPPQGIQWPYRDAQQILAPMQGGQYIVIGARPAVGKSVALADIARDAAIRQRKTVVIFSLEMSSQEYTRRMIAAEAGVRFKNMQNKTLTPQDWDKITPAAERIAQAPLHIIDDVSCTTADIRSRVRELKADLIILDYIQIGTMDPADKDRRQALEKYSRSLKIIAKSFNIPLCTAAQLNRNAASPDTPPRMSDLRETGALEQDADIIILLHRPDQEQPEHQRAGEVDYIVAKHRNGPTGIITLAAQLHYTRFTNLAHT